MTSMQTSEGGSPEAEPLETRRLLSRYLSGDHAAEAKLFERHRKLLLAQIGSHWRMRSLRHIFTEEDVADEVFLRLLSAGILKRFVDQGTGSLRRTLNDIAEKVLIDMHRRLQARITPVPIDNPGKGPELPIAAPDTSPTQKAQGVELHARCEQILSPREREVWKLVVDQGKDPSDAARELGIEPSTVRSLLRNARARLQDWLGCTGTE
jgi:RNA polymerase sigma factor (sigma-70 family)